MLPSEVRTKIQAEHREIEIRLRGLEAFVEAAPTERGARRTAILAHLRALAEVLLKHIDLEDSLLVPLIYGADCWGPERARLLTAHHQLQRTQLNDLLTWLDETADPTWSVVCSLVKQWVNEVRADMAYEDETYLDRHILRDDVVSVDMTAG